MKLDSPLSAKNVISKPRLRSCIPAFARRNLALVSRNLVLAGSTALALVLTAGSAQTQTVIVDGSTSIGLFLFDGETLIVEQTGVIETTIDDAVTAAANNITIFVKNYGSIIGFAFGIDAVNGALVLENNGAITGGIYGSIISGSNNSAGSIAGNTGIAATTAITDFINNGMIIGTQYGIEAGIITNFTNNGVIMGGIASTNAGIQMDFGAITNTGTISGRYGVHVDRTAAGNANIANSGNISSSLGVGGNAILFDVSGADILTLNAGSVLVGSVNWDGADDTLNMGAGLNAYVQFNSGTPTTTSFSSPFNASGVGFRAQIDISTMAAMGNVLNDVAGGIGSIVRTRIDTASLPLEQGAGDFSKGRTAWTSGWVASSSIGETSSTANTNHSSAGGVFGVDWNTPDGPLFGVYGGIGAGQLNVDVKNGQKIKTASYYGGAYKRWDMHAGTYDFNITGGSIGFKSERFIADNTVATGIATARADYTGLFVAPTLTYSKDHQRDNGDTFITSASLGYQGLFTQGYSETGSNASVTVGRRAIHQLTARGEVSLQKEKVLSSGTVLTLLPFAGVEGRLGVGGNNVTASLLGNTSSFNVGGNKAVGRGFVGAKFTAAMSNTKSLFGNIEGSWDSSNTQEIKGGLGFAVKF